MTNYVNILKNGKTTHPDYLEAVRLARQVSDSADTSLVEGVLRWRSNDRVPPAEIVALALYVGQEVDVPKCNAVRSAELSTFLAEVRAQDKPMSAEQRAEARAEMGPGPVVNMITGRVTIL